MYLGPSDRADDVYIGLSDGSVARARTIKRMEATTRHDPPFLQRLTARLWDPPGSGGPGDEELGPRPLVVVPPMAPGAPGGEQTEHRRVYITRADLDRHGYTQDCPGCTAAQTNQRPRTHSEGCRARLEEAMTQDELGRDRLLRAALRRAEPTDATYARSECGMRPLSLRVQTRHLSGRVLPASFEGRTSVSSVQLSRTSPSRARPV